METVPRRDDIYGDHFYSAAIHGCERVAHESGQMVYWIDHLTARDNARAVVVPELHSS